MEKPIIRVKDEIRFLVADLKLIKDIPSRKLLNDRLTYLRNFVPTEGDPCPIGYYWNDTLRECVFDVGK